MLLVLALAASSGVTLTPTHLVHRMTIRRRMRWDSITAVTQDRSMGSRYVRVWTSDGRSRWLRAPYVPFLRIGERRFERDFHVIGQWWLEHRGPLVD